MPFTFLLFLCLTGAFVIIAGFINKDEPIDHIEPDDLMDRGLGMKTFNAIKEKNGADWAKVRQMADRLHNHFKSQGRVRGTPESHKLIQRGSTPRPATNFRARNGIDLMPVSEYARSGCLVGHSKTPRQKQETTTSFLWTSRLHWLKPMRFSLGSASWIAKLLLWLKLRNPFSVGCSLPHDERRSEQSAVSEVRNPLNGGGSASKACQSYSETSSKDAGSIPAASTTLPIQGLVSPRETEGSY